MLRKELTVTESTTTDTGRFTAIAAAYSVDRQGDQIVPGAFAATIRQWTSSGKVIPVHWDHEGEAKNVIGIVFPSSMREVDDGLYVEGKLDLEASETAREAWRAMKLGAMSLSFGYVATEQEKRADGVNELRAIDLFEISVVPHPANADTRFLSFKAHDDAFARAVADAVNDAMATAKASTEEAKEREQEKAAIRATVAARREKAAARARRKAQPIKVAVFDLD